MQRRLENGHPHHFAHSASQLAYRRNDVDLRRLRKLETDIDRAKLDDGYGEALRSSGSLFVQLWDVFHVEEFIALPVIAGWRGLRLMKL